MKNRELDIGVRVRYIGQKRQFKNIILLLLVNRTGVITGKSTDHGYDWEVSMDEGAYDISAKSEALIPIDDNDADNLIESKKELEDVFIT